MTQFKYLTILAMISVTFLNVAMLFTYRLIEVGPLLVPGGVIAFSLTYIIADVVAEVYGYKNAKSIVWGNFCCIFVFNFTALILLQLPAYTSSNYPNEVYTELFSHSIIIVCGYSCGFLLGDLFNAYAVSKLGILYKGKYFALRSITASFVGQAIFSAIVSSMIYATHLNKALLMRQFSTTIIAKLVIITVLAYPCTLLVSLLKRLEGNERLSKINNISNVHVLFSKKINSLPNSEMDQNVKNHQN